MKKNKPKKDKKIKENAQNLKKGDKIKKSNLHPETKKSIWLLVLLALFFILILSVFDLSGPGGKFIFSLGSKLFGVGYYILPLTILIVASTILFEKEQELTSFSLLGAISFIFFSLGLIDILSEEKGGIVGNISGQIKYLFGAIGGGIITLTLVIISLLIIVNKPLKIPLKRKEFDKLKEEEFEIIMPKEEKISEEEEKNEKIEKRKEKEKSEKVKVVEKEESLPSFKPFTKSFKNYTPPPLNLLSSQVEKPTIGDLRANANIIKRTLESFGIPVEMGEINVGPTVTRYTLKPAEGIKLSRITSLNQDLALALAAHPIRIEAPIPGKSLVGIEVPNKSAALVRLGSLFLYDEFHKSGYLGFALGRNVSGEPVFKDISKMPHLLIAGATGSGKSIMIHSIILSLLYKNSPETLRLILIDPKRVELSVYDGIPHLLSPVITDNKKSIGVLKWAIQEMDNRYQTLLESGARDIKSYNSSNEKKMPYIVIFIDELADLMASYGREVEGSIIRLAQMARATGIHLVVSTQRPSVEVITGLIKANITSRIALQVASQIDSRTILDAPGAEKLLGHGDALFISAELSKPLRVQGAFVSEEEIKKVAKFIRENNETKEESLDFDENNKDEAKNGINIPLNFEDFDEEEDELLEEAIKTVRAAKKASASLLQRRLKIGYARAARLLDIMEEKGIVGPQDGAKPREVFYNNEDNE
jgi:S-DNA-T family DNA segregation ATPase FtsK/SpoIIIE